MDGERRSLPRGRRPKLRILDNDIQPEADDIQAERPRTRADCQGGERPCPWVGCRHHLYLEVAGQTITPAFPDKAPWDLAISCSLDIADAGAHKLEDIGIYLQLTRERVRQIEAAAVKKARAELDEDLFLPEDMPDPKTGQWDMALFDADYDERRKR